MPVKILQLVTQRQYRGAEVFAASLSGELLERGHEIVFAGLYNSSAHVLNVAGAKNFDLGGQKKFIDLKLLRNLIRLIRAEKPDIIQANGSDTLKYSVWARFFCPSVKITYRNISMVSSWTKKGGFRYRFNKWLMNKVDFVTSVGEEPMNDLISTYSYPLALSKVIKRGVPVLRFDKKSEKEKIALEFGISPEDFLMVHVGQFSAEKNHRFLIGAFEKLSIHNENVHLLLVGEGKLLPEMRQLVAEKGLTERVHFAGYRNPVQQVMAAGDLFVLTSLIEGVPGVVIEAGMQQLPTLAVSVGGVGEVVIPNQTGLLLPSHDMDAFVASAEQLIQDKALSIRLGQAAQAYVLENYSLEKCADHFEQLYLQLINRNK